MPLLSLSLHTSSSLILLLQNEVFALRFTFDAQYPISSPEVVFIDDGKHHIPMHPHVYSNGHVSFDRSSLPTTASDSPAGPHRSVLLSWAKNGRLF